MIGFILFGIPAAIVAKVKGFNSLRWLLALGVIGLIAVIYMQNANSPDLTPEEKDKRIGAANNVGAWLCYINIALSVVIMLFVLALN
jgi:hypothetical protein